MQGSTISVSPIPQSTTTEKIRDIFHAFTVNNVHIDGKTAYVQFADEGDYDNLEIQFDNYEVAELNNAKIDKLQHFDWSSTKKEDTSPNKQSSSSSSRHEDLMAADIENLIIIQNCDEDILRNLTVENIRDFFKSFPSVHRIVKRKNDVVVEFTNIAELQGLDNVFGDYHVSQLGKNASIEKADRYKVDPGDFVSDWQKFHAKQSLVTQPTTNLGYKDDKPSSGELEQGERYPTGSKEEKSSQQFLHHDIIPPFDKKTSMQVNFLNEQSKLGYKQEMKHEPIHQASTHQELDYTSEIKIESENRFGYDAAEKQQEEQRKREQEQRRKEQQQRKRQQQEQKCRQEETRRKEQQERKRKQEEQRVRKQQEQRKRKEQQQLKKKKQEQARLKKQKEEEEAKQREEQEARKRAQQERMDRELRQKLIAQRAKFMKEIQMKKSQQEKQEEKHQVPTESQNAATEGQFVKKAEQTIEQQLGYAVNKAKEESVNLVNAGLELLKGKTEETKEKLGYDEQKLKEQGQKIVNSGKETIKEIGQKINQLGYREQPKPLQEGKNLLDTGLSFLKSSFQKIQEQLSNKAATGINSGDKKGPSELGYEKWSVKPDVVVEKPVSQPQNRTLVTLITITLFIWVIFLLMQDTSTVVQEIKEIQIQVPPPTEQSV